MLLKIREVTAGKFSYFIVGLISVPFALWGVNYYFQGGFDPAVIEVGSSEIPLSQFIERFNQRKREVEAAVGSSGQMPPDETIDREVVGSLVREALLIQEADRRNYRVSDAVLAREIMNFPDFMTDGRFDGELYRNLLGARRQSQAVFEESFREQLRRAQLRRAIETSSFTLPHERELFDRFLLEERSARYLRFPIENYIEPDGVEDERVRTYYDENLKRFVTPELFSLKYIELNVEDIAAGIEVDEGELLAYYDDNRDLFATPERRIFSHILVDPDRHGQNAAGRRAREVHEELEQGEDFAELAKLYSDDSLTADQGGELPPLVYEDLEEHLAAPLFALREGEFSEPLESDFGLQIFKLIAIESSARQAFGEVRDVVSEQFRREQAEAIYNEEASRLEILAYEYPQGLEQVAKSLETVDEVKSVGPLDMGGNEGPFRYPRIKAAVYEERVLNEYANSEMIEVEPGHALVVRVDEGAYQPSRQRSFEEVKGEISETLLKEDAWLAASAAVGEALGQLQEQSATQRVTLNELARQQSTVVRTLDFVRRNDGSATPQIVRALFRIPETVGGYTRARIGTDESYAIVEMTGVRLGETPLEEAGTEEEEPQLHLGTSEFNMVLIGFLQRTSVEVNAEEIEKYRSR